MQTLAVLAALLVSTAGEPEVRPTVIVVVGAAGAPEYEAPFAEWAGRWEQAAARGGAELVRIGSEGDESTTDRERLRQQIAGLSAENPEPVWLVLIGHGTFDGQHARFNLAGPDVTATELAEWLQPVQRPLAIVNCASASGPFLNRLSGRNRTVVTATKSGFEHNYARFGDYLSQAIDDPAADLDKDGQTSLLEGWLAAAARVQEFYDQDARLATEHSLLDDNGDGLGTPADFFRGIRVIKSTNDAALPDGSFANQFVLVRRGAEAALSPELRQRRDAIELEIARLRQQKGALDEEEYYRQLEALLIPLAELYREAGSEERGVEDAVPE